jgi:hypothetical protein
VRKKISKESVLKLHLAKAKKTISRINTEQADTVIDYMSKLKVRGAIRAGVDLVCRRGKRTSAKLKVGLRYQKVRGRGKWQCISSLIRIQAAYDKETRFKTLGNKYELHPKSIARNSILVAAVFMKAQDEWLDHALKACSAYRMSSSWSSS